MKLREYNIVVAGVGGQGVLTLSRIIAYAALIEGYHVRVGETLGMSQRFGIVQSYIRFGTHVKSPLIPLGGAHALLGLEPVEAVRALKYLNKRSLAIVNSHPIPSITTITGREKYPSIEQLESILKERSGKSIMINAQKIATDLKLPIGVGVLLLGIFSAQPENPINVKNYINAIKYVVPRNVDENIKLFKKGIEIAKTINKQ